MGHKTADYMPRHRHLPIWMAGLVFIMIGGCCNRRIYDFPTIEVESARVSPTYRLEILNGTSSALRIFPREADGEESVLRQQNHAGRIGESSGRDGELV